MARRPPSGPLSHVESPRIDAFRRELQRCARVTSDVRALFREEVRTLDADVARASSRAGDRETRAHLADVRNRIKKIPDPK